jgi:predicted AlkP superfamily pyrophosphatase or phosphodiesterase
MQCGGDPVGGQHTSTMPGFTTIYSGLWGDVTGVKDNGDNLKAGIHLIQYTLADTVLNGGLNQNVEFAYEKWVTWDTAWANNFDSAHKPAKLTNQEFTAGSSETCDLKSFNYAESVIGTSSVDALFWMYSQTDYAGHSTGFSPTSPKYCEAVKDGDLMMRSLIQGTLDRSTYNNEDWMYVITTDHGGTNKGHGGTSLEESTTFFITND